MQNEPTSLARDSAAAMPSDLKVQNRIRILRAFRDGQEYTAGDVSAATGISKLTVMRAIQFFCAKNVLIPTGKGSSTDVGGKKPVCFKLHASKHLLSITLWPGHLNFALYDMLCSRESYIEIPMTLPSDVDELFGIIRSRVGEYLLENHVSTKELYGVGLSTSGTVDYRTKQLKYNSLNPEWGADVPFGEYLGDIFGPDVAIFVENAGKMTGRSALLDPSLENHRVLVLFTTWGLSACLIENGHILNGRDSLIGEIGHMTIDPHATEECGCGGHGCFERMVDIRRIRRSISLDPPDINSLLFGKPTDDITVQTLFDASERGDAYARRIVRDVAGIFAVALRNISLVFNPDVVLFQGDYSRADDYFDRSLREELARFRYFPKSGPFGIRYDTRSLFELDARGAAVTLADMYFAEPSIYADDN